MNYILFIFFTGAMTTLLIGLGSYAFRYHRTTPSAGWFSLTLLWAGGRWLTYALEIVLVPLEAKIVAAHLAFLVTSFSGWVGLTLALALTGHFRWLGGWSVLTLAVIPASLSWLSVSGATEHWFMFDFRLGEFGPALFTPGPGMIISAITVYAQLSLALIVLARAWHGAARIERRRYAIALLALIFPVSVDGLFRLGLSPIPGINLAAISTGLSGLWLAWAMWPDRRVAARAMARHHLVEQMRDAMLVFDSQDRLVDFNSAAGQLLALAPSDLGKPAATLLAAHPEFWSWYEKAEPSEALLPVRARTYQASLIPIHDTARPEHSRLIVLRDQTAELHQIQIARANAEKYRLLFESEPDALFLIDSETGKILDANQAACGLFGYPREEILRLYQNDLAVSPDTPQPVQTSRPDSPGLYQRRRDGTLFPAQLTLIPVPFNPHPAWLALYRDRSAQMQTENDLTRLQLQSLANLRREISLRQQIEAELRQAKQAADAANRAKSQFLANMSHEIRTPLNAILGFAQIMRRDATLSPTHHHNLATIQASGEHLLALINDLLDLSKIEAGKMTRPSERVDLAQLLASLDRLFRLRAEELGLTWHVDISAEVPPWVISHERTLRQILINLLGNAFKFTAQGCVTLRVSRAPTAPDTSRLQFQVCDTGRGIAADDLEHIFEPFGQAANSAGQEGTGLGLALARQFARLLGGDLTVTSTLAQGSCFTLAVPLPASADPPAGSASDPACGATVLAPHQTARRILIVDDQATHRDLLVAWLQTIDTTPPTLAVQQASDGQAAIDLWETWQPHLIFMDLRMPRVTGQQATQEIKTRLRARADAVPTKIIALTASVLENEDAAFYSAGGDALAFKPIAAEQLGDLLTQQLGLEFIKLASPDPPSTLAPDQVVRRWRALAPHPAWRGALYRAVELGDFEQAKGLLADLREQDAALYAHLAAWTHNYNRPALLDLLKQEETS